MAPALDWRDASHYAARRDGAPILLACHVCGRPTPLRDDDRRPAHKLCAEGAPAPAVGLEVAAGAQAARRALEAARSTA